MTLSLNGVRVADCRLRSGKKTLTDSHLHSSTCSSLALAFGRSRPGNCVAHRSETSNKLVLEFSCEQQKTVEPGGTAFGPMEL